MLVNKVFNDIKKILTAEGKDTLYVTLKENKADYTINFFKTAAIKIKLGKKNYFYIKAEPGDLPGGYKLQVLKSMPGFVRFELNENQNFNELSNLLSFLYDRAIVAPIIFGCCNSFELCSDAKKCVNKDPILALGCMYRENLEKGRIFYGKNRNV